MSIDPELLTTTCSIFRPFGNSTPLETDVACRLIPDVPCGRGSGLSGALAWTHYMDCQPDTDVIDQLTRSIGSNALNYADGDEVQIPSSSPEGSFVVVMVTRVNAGSAEEFTRVFMMRSTGVL